MANGTPPPYAPPVLPQSYAIPVQLIETWLRISPADYVNVRLTRGDWDNLFIAINKLVDTQVHLQGCWLHWTNGNVSAANVSFHESQRTTIEAQNALRSYFAAVMASATQG